MEGRGLRLHDHGGDAARRQQCEPTDSRQPFRLLASPTNASTTRHACSTLRLEQYEDLSVVSNCSDTPALAPPRTLTPI